MSIFQGLEREGEGEGEGNSLDIRAGERNPSARIHLYPSMCFIHKGMDRSLRRGEHTLPHPHIPRVNS